MSFRSWFVACTPFGIRLPKGIRHGLGKRMAEAKVYVSIRGDAIRIAPHLYNDESDIEKLFAVMRKLIYSKIEFEQFYYCLAPTQ